MDEEDVVMLQQSSPIDEVIKLAAAVEQLDNEFAKGIVSEVLAAFADNLISQLRPAVAGAKVTVIHGGKDSLN